MVQTNTIVMKNLKKMNKKDCFDFILSNHKKEFESYTLFKRFAQMIRTKYLLTIEQINYLCDQWDLKTQL